MLQILDNVKFLVGNEDVIAQMSEVCAKTPFANDVIEFLDDFSKILMRNSESRKYPDVVTFGFWIRKGSLIELKRKHGFRDDNIHLGKGVAFHITPSNVPVNFAYSLAAGLLAGNSNIVRVPGKSFAQVELIVEGLKKTLEKHQNFRNYIALIRYERSKEINDYLSDICDTRIIWGGDSTIEEIRKSKLPPRSTEITFADRYSLTVIDSDTYMQKDNKSAIAYDFYNDTYLTDQNACTSPRVVVWIGNQRDEAKELFWDALHMLVMEKYSFQPIQGVNKLTNLFLCAVEETAAKVVKHNDNLIIRVIVPIINSRLMDLKGNSGFFYEYDCKDVLELKSICDDKRCQTIGVLGDKKKLIPLLTSGIKGVDRVVDIGHTMDFGLSWDGINLVEALTRTISIV